MIIVNTDGLCEPNPGGIATYGWVAYEDQEKIGEGYEVVVEGPEATNNVAEYSGIIAALRWLLENNLERKEVVLKSDSQLCIKQLTGEFRVRAPGIIPLYQEATDLLSNFNHIKLEWVRREENEEADELSRKAKEKRQTKNTPRVISQGDDIYIVSSESKVNTFYTVDMRNKTCSCPDHTMRKRKCKHIKLIEGNKLEVDKEVLEKVYNVLIDLDDEDSIEKNWSDIEDCIGFIGEILSR